MNRSKEDLLRDSMARVPRQHDITPKTIEVTERRFNSRSFSSPFVLIAVFLVLVAIGTILLMSPFSHHGSGLSNLPIALFTATSAVTVTGLTAVDTAYHWTKIGQCVILCLMFVGGLGFMSLCVLGRQRWWRHQQRTHPHRSREGGEKETHTQQTTRTGGRQARLPRRENLGHKT